MDKRKLSDRTLKSLKARGELYDVWDLTTPGFGVRVAPSGRITFVLAAHVPGKFGTRRALGMYGVITLAEARQKAANWKKLIQRGIDPADEEARQRAAEQRKRATTVASVAEAFIADKLPDERKRAEAARNLRTEFGGICPEDGYFDFRLKGKKRGPWYGARKGAIVGPLGARPIAEISSADIATIIKAKAKAQKAPAQARNLLALAKRFFQWAVGQVDEHGYSLESSPAAQLKAKDLCGDKISGERVLTDDELFALWRAAERTPHPHGPVYQLLILSGLRLNEAADASKGEFDLENKFWTIPAARMKGKNGKARPHVVPLTPDILAIVDTDKTALSEDSKKDHFLFSTTHGASPVWMSAKIKNRIEEGMLDTLRDLARNRGGDPAAVTLPHWTNHDIRRSVATKMAEMGVMPHIVEAVLNHASGHKAGVAGVYNRAMYAAEKREALEKWAAKVRSLSQPAASNDVRLRATT